MSVLLTVILVFSALVIVGAVLLQPAKGGASLIGGSSNSVFGSSGGTTLLFRVTLVLGLLIMAICLVLSRMKIQENKESDIDDPVATTPLKSAPSIPANGAATAPAEPAKNSK